MSKAKEVIKKSIKPYYKTLQNNTVKVSLFIVGAQKAGTSALHNYLAKHPNIIGGEEKELNFFTHQENYDKGHKWYHKQFVRPLFRDDNNIYLDSTPEYMSDLSVAPKIYNYNPNAKIIMLLRNPVDRAYSAWNMFKQASELSGAQKQINLKRYVYSKNLKKLIYTSPFPTFGDFVDDEIQDGNIVNVYPNFISRGIYYNQVKAYLDLFGSENVFIYESEYFKSNKLKITNDILEMLGIQNFKMSENDLQKVHTRKYNSQISQSTKQKLKVFYEPHNKKLFKLLGTKFDW